MVDHHYPGRPVLSWVTWMADRGYLVTDDNQLEMYKKYVELNKEEEVNGR